MGRILGLDGEVIDEALARLAGDDLIARQGQVVQVLPIPETTVAAPVGQSLQSAATTPREVACRGRSSSDDPSTEPEAPPAQEELTVEPYLAQARAQMARLLGRRVPAESRVRALARSLAIKAQEVRRG